MERFCVGVDVSAKTLEVAYRGEKGQLGAGRFDNEAEGHDRLVRHLQKRSRGKAVRVVLESTGVYGIDAALALHRAGFEVMIANPRAAANFAKAELQRSKTDRLDAAMLLAFAEKMTFRPWQPPTDQQLQVRSINRRVYALVNTVREEKNRMHAAEYVKGNEIVRRSIRATIKALDKEIARLRAAALKLIAADPLMKRRFELLVSAKGIGQVSAIAILAELTVLPADMTDRQWVAHAGLDPRQFESGTSIKMPARISKRGNRYLRAALYLPATVACRFEPGVAAFSTALRQRGKKPLQVHVAVMRKLLHAIHAMFASDQPFNGSRFYGPAAGAVGTSGIAPSAISEVSTAHSC